MTKARLFRTLLSDPRPIVLIGAHNGLSARLGEEAGFPALWASGFEISGSQAIPDANILTMAENLAITRNVNDSAEIPVIADCDNGYGNAINVMRMVIEYEKAGIAGVCIEDNIFPKRCSFYAGVRRELESQEEFAGKIRAAKQTQRNRDFVIIARTESLIAGLGMEEALSRGRAYADAGADMVLIHSKSSEPSEVMEFARAWDRDCPLVAVPTTYDNTSVTDLSEAGFKAVIFANHGLRAGIKNAQETLATLWCEQRASAIADKIVSMNEVYRLMGVGELQANEAQYLPKGGRNITAVIVAAGKGFEDELMPLIADKPKALLDVKGKTILERQIESLHNCQINEIAVVRGYKKEMMNVAGARYYDNDLYAQTNVLASLFCAEDELSGRVLVLYGDIVFDESILQKLLKSKADITLVVDHARFQSPANGDLTSEISKPELVRTTRRLTSPGRFLPHDTLNSALKIGRDLDQANAEFIGMAMFSEKGTEVLKRVYHDARARFNGQPFHEAPNFERASLSDIFQEMLTRDIEIACLDIYKGWMEVDTFDDYRKMWAEIES